MKQTILVAGATGNLGRKIVRALLQNGADVRALVREDSDAEKVKLLESLGANIYTLNSWTLNELANACAGVACVVSALAGLQDVIIDAQKILLDAAIEAGVPRFIPSDYSLDFRKFADGENRNLDLRRRFHQYLDTTNVQATTIFNGAFMDLLTGAMPVIFFKKHMVLYWGNTDRKWDFTTMDDTAAYTAKAALDLSSPRYLCIAGDQISPREIRAVMNELTGKKFRLIRTGGAGLLGIIIKIARFFSPGKHELYPAWQGMQYMHNMIDDRSLCDKIDNNRYDGIRWMRVREFLSESGINS